MAEQELCETTPRQCRGWNLPGNHTDLAHSVFDEHIVQNVLYFYSQFSWSRLGFSLFEPMLKVDDAGLHPKARAQRLRIVGLWLSSLDM